MLCEWLEYIEQHIREILLSCVHVCVLRMYWSIYSNENFVGFIRRTNARFFKAVENKCSHTFTTFILYDNDDSFRKDILTFPIESSVTSMFSNFNYSISIFFPTSRKFYHWFVYYGNTGQSRIMNQCSKFFIEIWPFILHEQKFRRYQKWIIIPISL